MTVPPALCAIGDSYPLLSGQDGKGAGAKHKALALEAAELGASTRVVDVKKHCA